MQKDEVKRNVGKVRVIQVNENITARNDSIADAIRERLKSNHTFFVNVMSSPGSGKTTLLVSLIQELKKKYRIKEMDVDITSVLDAQRVADATGIESVQIHNGGLCHIDADMVERALAEISLEDTDLLILENIGNLVCPAEFDTGAHKNIMILSVPEGDDKPLKYPLMFQVSDVVIISKLDTMDFFDFNLEEAKKRILRLNPKAEIFPLSVKTGEGLDALVKWMQLQIEQI